MALPVTDTFTNTNGTTLTAHDSGWSDVAGNWDIQNNCAHADQPNNPALCRWTTDSFTDDQYAESTIDTTGTGRIWTGPAVRIDASGNAYGVDISPTDNTLYITEFTAGVPAALTSTAQTPGNGHTIRIEIIGSTIDVYYNGSGTPTLSTTDSTLTSGSAGVEGWDDGEEIMLTDWEAGNLGSVPTAKPTLMLLGIG